MHDKNGKPDLDLAGEAKAQIEKRNITKIHLSLTHTKNYAYCYCFIGKKITRIKVLRLALIFLMEQKNTKIEIISVSAEQTLEIARSNRRKIKGR